MADTRPTKLNIFYKVYLCFLVIFYPKQLSKEEKKDEERRKLMSPPGEPEHRAYIIRRAFWSSLGLIILFGFFGYLAGIFLWNWLGQPSKRMIIILQITGASLLLWGTLFVRGWEILTFSNVTLSEHVNRWIYRTLCCLGTSILICSLMWPKL